MLQWYHLSGNSQLWPVNKSASYFSLPSNGLSTGVKSTLPETVVKRKEDDLAKFTVAIFVRPEKITSERLL